jgi:hypothetical protein
MYIIQIFSENSNFQFSEIEEVCARIDKAKKIINEFIKDAFNGETILAYSLNESKNYPNIIPDLKICKKTDWRYGEDENSEPKNRKKFLKYKYLKKI